MGNSSPTCMRCEAVGEAEHRNMWTWLLAKMGTRPRPTPEPPAKPQAMDSRSEAAELLAEINEARHRFHCRRLEPLQEATRQAGMHAHCMARAGRANHQGFTDRAFLLGRATVSENVAAGQRTAVECVADWLQHPDHKFNLLNRDYTECGVGVSADVDGVRYWCAIFCGSGKLRAMIERHTEAA